MISLRPIIDRINTLLEEDTDASVTYAALEARLALEKVCYDRLRQCHDYISHAQLKRWQPRQVINTLLEDVDPHATQTLTLHMSRKPAMEGVELEDDDYVEIGTVVGFDPKRIERMWNALAKLALHVRLPKRKDDHIPDYGDKTKVHAKVTEIVAELERLAKGTMTFSGVPIGGDVTFECTCGENNRRRAALLKDGQHVYCMNPECKEMWQVVKQEDGGIGFEADRVTIDCEQCKAPNHMARRLFLEMKTDQIANFLCRSCDHQNYVQWRLMQVTPKTPEYPAPSESGPMH